MFAGDSRFVDKWGKKPFRLLCKQKDIIFPLPFKTEDRQAIFVHRHFIFKSTKVEYGLIRSRCTSEPAAEKSVVTRLITRNCTMMAY